MASSGKSEPADLAGLLQGVVADTEKLVGEHFRFLRSELREELNHAKSMAQRVGAGAGLVATGGVLSTLMAVHLLHKTTRLPLWGCYGLVAGALGGAGIQLLWAARREADRIRFPAFPQTAEVLKEDAAWLKEAVTT
jgi:hypothetical protein